MRLVLFAAATALLQGLAFAAADETPRVAVDAPPAKEDLYTGPKTPPGARKHIGKRAATCGTTTRLTAAQAQESVTAHNLYRALEPAANEKSLAWSDEMAAVAQAYADQCIWAHGMLFDCSNNRLGQNLYVQSSSAGFPTLNLTAVIWNWWNERNDWVWAQSSCTPNKLCGHWTQLVHSESILVGCAYKNCPTMNVGGEVWQNALYVVCDYTPPGNVEGVAFYLKGASCSNCDTAGTGAGYKCVNKLCVPCTPKNDAACKCAKQLDCGANGVWSNDVCACVCNNKFYGLQCTTPCSCADLMPDDCPDWSDYCTNPDYKDFMMENCRSFCKFPCNLPPTCAV
jgi:hypothetical protein